MVPSNEKQANIVIVGPRSSVGAGGGETFSSMRPSVDNSK